MDEADESPPIHNRVQRHAPQLEQVDFLFVELRNLLIWIGEARVGEIIFIPILHKLLEFIWPNRQDLCFPRSEFRIPISQTRQLRAAIRSHEAAQESQYNNFLSTEIR